MEKEVRPDTEWTLFDDSKVLSVTGHWKDIVSDCVTAKIQPTVLLYEKLTEDDLESIDKVKSSVYTFTDSEIDELL